MTLDRREKHDFDAHYYPYTGALNTSGLQISWAGSAYVQSDWDAHLAALSQVNLENAVKSSLVNKILGDADLSVFIGESPMLAKSIVSLASGVLGAVSSLKRGRIEDAIRSLIKGINGARSTQTGILTPEQRSFASKAGRTKKLLEAELLLAQKVKTWREGKKKFRNSETGKRIKAEIDQLRKQRSEALKGAYGPPVVDTGDISAAVLSLRYAWQPAIESAYDFTMMLDNQLVSKELRFKASKRQLSKFGVRSNGNLAKQGTDAEMRVRGRVILKRRPSNVEISGIHNPRQVIWELIPYSFVVDWFIPIGDYLRAQGVTPDMVRTYQQMRFTIAKSRETSFSPYKAGYNPYSSGGTVYKNGRFKMEKIDMVRNTPSWSARLPSTKTLAQAFSTTHMQNAAALIHQRIRAALR